MCLVALVVGVAGHNERGLVVLADLLAAGALVAGIVLVASDSAVWHGLASCLLDPSPTKPETKHFEYLYGIWGAALIGLLVHAGYLLASEPPRPRPAQSSP